MPQSNIASNINKNPKKGLAKIFSWGISVLGKELLIKRGIPLKKCLNSPYLITFEITERCNASCITCDIWKKIHPSDIPIDKCKEILRQMHAWTLYCGINFTGGEPFARDDFYEILIYANSLNFYTTVATNGVALDKKNCDRIVATGLNYINVSLNTIDPCSHDDYKGVAGLHQRIVEAIKYIKKKTKKIKICLSVIITSNNYRTLNDFFLWSLNIGADGVDFVPVHSSFGHDMRATGAAIAAETDPLLHIDDFNKFDHEINLLIGKKRKGYPVVTPFHDLRMLKTYYRNPNKIPKRNQCGIGFKNLYIRANGDVKFCYYYPPIGNIMQKDIKQIWFSDDAQRQRLQLLRCTRNCACAALRNFSLTDKFSIFLMRSGLSSLLIRSI